MHDLSQFTPATFRDTVATTLAAKDAVISIPATHVVSTLTRKQLQAFFDIHVPHKDSWAAFAVTILPMFSAAVRAIAFIATVLGFRLNRHSVDSKRAALTRLFNATTLQRPVITLTTKELGLMRGMAELCAANALTPAEWGRFYATIVAGDLKTCGFALPPGLESDKFAPEARTLLRKLLQDTQPAYDAELADAAQRLARLGASQPALAPAVSLALSEGAHWMTDDEMASSSVFSLRQEPRSVLVGYSTTSSRPVYFNGHESLLTIGGAGSGKTQSQVIPNLLTYPGSAIVLDVKGEGDLWQKTAAHRQANFGPVYRFAPLDPQGRTHRFNPFDYISAQPDTAAIDCEVFGYQIIAHNPKLHDPYWENKGRDFLWAFAMLIALNASKRRRNIENLAELAAINLSLLDPKSADPLHKDTATVIKLWRSLATTHSIPDLNQAANAIEKGITTEGDRLESVMDTMRRYLSPFARSHIPRTALSASDWHPLDFRRRPGTTLYICIPDDDLPSFAPLVRLLFAQHLRLLKPQQVNPKDPPITFFLDEMPQLGNFQSILNMQDTGRSAGLRLWMFAQSVQQILNAYGEQRGEGLISGSRVRCYFQPQDKTAEHLSRFLGKTRNIFTGEERPLATVDELAGHKYSRSIITMPRGDHPVLLEGRPAHQHQAHLFKPPPVVKKAAPPP